VDTTTFSSRQSNVALKVPLVISISRWTSNGTSTSVGAQMLQTVTVVPSKSKDNFRV
jgi:hypothetical protein